MHKIYYILILGYLSLSCKQNASDKKSIQKTVVYNQDLVDELKKMAEIDQIAAYIPQGAYKKLSEEAWLSFKDSVYTTHYKRIKELFDTHGFLGYDLVGKEGSSNFWVMVQHSDHDSKFQENVLKKMKIDVDNANADSQNYGLLVDRVKLNTGQLQVYGTQVSYYPKTRQAFSIALADSINVNKRRKSLGFEPLEIYLNDMSKAHFEMNKEGFLQLGITEPKLYKTD